MAIKGTKHAIGVSNEGQRRQIVKRVHKIGYKG